MKSSKCAFCGNPEAPCDGDKGVCCEACVEAIKAAEWMEHQRGHYAVAVERFREQMRALDGRCRANGKAKLALNKRNLEAFRKRLGLKVSVSGW